MADLLKEARECAENIDRLLTANEPCDIAAIIDAAMRAREAKSNEIAEWLRLALAKIEDAIDENDGRDQFGYACGRCEGGLPIEHSWACKAKAALEGK